MHIYTNIRTHTQISMYTYYMHMYSCCLGPNAFLALHIKKNPCFEQNLRNWHCTNTRTHTHAHTHIYTNTAHVAFEPRTFLLSRQGKKWLCVCILTLALPQECVAGTTKSRKRRMHDKIALSTTTETVQIYRIRQ